MVSSKCEKVDLDSFEIQPFNFWDWKILINASDKNRSEFIGNDLEFWGRGLKLK